MRSLQYLQHLCAPAAGVTTRFLVKSVGTIAGLLQFCFLQSVPVMYIPLCAEPQLDVEAGSHVPDVPAVYSPLKRHGLDKPGMKVGVVGLGGVGHAAVLIGKVLSVVVTCTSAPARHLYSVSAKSISWTLKQTFTGAMLFLISRGSQLQPAIICLESLTCGVPHSAACFISFCLGFCTRCIAASC